MKPTASAITRMMAANFSPKGLSISFAHLTKLLRHTKSEFLDHGDHGILQTIGVRCHATTPYKRLAEKAAIGGPSYKVSMTVTLGPPNFISILLNAPQYYWQKCLFFEALGFF